MPRLLRFLLSITDISKLTREIPINLQQTHLTVGVVALTEDNESLEKRVNVLPPNVAVGRLLQPTLPQLHRLRVTWELSGLGNDYLEPNVSLVFTIVDEMGTVFVSEEDTQLSAQTYDTADLIAPIGTNFTLITRTRISWDGVSLDSEETRQEGLQVINRLLVPTTMEIAYTVTSRTVTVHWRNVPEGVGAYQLMLRNLDLLGPQPQRPAPISVQTNNSYTFTDLLENTTYELSVTPIGSSDLYLEGPTYTISGIRTDLFDQLPRPYPNLVLGRLFNIFASWQAVNGADSYLVSLHVGMNADSPAVRTLTLPDTNVRFDNLQADTNYTVRVVAVAQSDDLRDSNPATATIRTRDASEVKRFQATVFLEGLLSGPSAVMLSDLFAAGLVPADATAAGLNVDAEISVHPLNLDITNTTSILRDHAATESQLGIVDWVVIEVRVVPQGAAIPTDADDGHERLPPCRLVAQ